MEASYGREATSSLRPGSRRSAILASTQASPGERRRDGADSVRRIDDGDGEGTRRI
jgi:hypothetical protein